MDAPKFFTWQDLLRDYLVCNIWASTDAAIEDLRANGLTQYAANEAVECNQMFMKFQEEIHAQRINQ
jgi:hypothetical protein